MNFYKYFTLLLTIACFSLLEAQPLRFIDASVDSVKAVASHVDPTSDDGWVISTIVNDSIVQFSKFDYCGKVEWNKWLYSKGKINNSSTSILNDKIYFSANFSDSTKKGIFVVTANMNGLVSKSKLLSFRDMNFYSNPKIVFSGNDLYMGVNVGNDNDRTRFTLIKMDTSLNPIETRRLENEKEVHDFSIDGNKKFYATLNSNEFIRFDNAGTVDYTRRYATSFDKFGDNIIIGNNNVFLLGYRLRGNIPFMRMVKLSLDGEYQNHSEFLTYDPRVPVKAMTDKSNIYVINVDTTESKGVRNMYCSIFNNLGNLSNRITNELLKNASEIRSLDVAYLENEKNIISAGVIEDSIFHSKQTATFENACGDSLKLIAFGRDTIVTDTLINDRWLKFVNPAANDINDSIGVKELKVSRLCEKFDLKDGEVKSQECRGATVTIGNTNGYPNATYNWSNGATTPSIQVVVPTEVSQTIKYCDKTVTITYKVEVFSPIVPSPINYPEGCPNDTIKLRVKAPEHYSRLIEWNDKSKDTTKVKFYSPMRNSSLSDTVTLSYCKNVPGSQEIKFTQIHNYRTHNTVSAKSEIKVALCPDSDSYFQAEYQSTHKKVEFEWDDPIRTRNQLLVFRYTSANINQMNTVQMKFYCDSASSKIDTTISQKHIASLAEKCIDIKFPNVVSLNSESAENKIFKAFFVKASDKNNVSTFNLKIYNRWGKKVYESSKLDEGWDLQYKEEPAAIDTYIYVCEVKDVSGNVSEFKGDVTVVR
ncbi:MAG TPA: gliding motility-associated C-terminal domain-containing protein [Saprospiraceae bacterium]|nr:gliding motility-associated C-terminal domain-containing protein [Saprospiraceae bacterium]